MTEYTEVVPHNGLMDGIAWGVGVPVEALRLLLTIVAGKLIYLFDFKDFFLVFHIERLS